jgi:hypothetical protein
VAGFKTIFYTNFSTLLWKTHNELIFKEKRFSYFRKFSYFAGFMITIDFSYFETLGAMSPIAIMWRLFADGGWIPLVWVFLWGSWHIWVNWRQNLYGATRRFVFLAVDIPKTSLEEPGQSPRAVENIFAHLDGAHASDTLWEKYWEGKTQDFFSFEIVSIEGYIQFIIRTRDKFRDLVEAAIYAQYPDAEITEVVDYTQFAPKKFPDPEIEMFGSEWINVKPEAYPLRTYHDFIDPESKEFKDPMAAILENMAKMGKGEQLWFQMTVTPISQKGWIRAGEEIVKKLIGAKVEKKKTLMGQIIDLPMKVIDAAMGQIVGGEETAPKKAEKVEPSQILYLSPGTKATVEAIEKKISKIGFKTKIRIIYLAKKEIFKKARAAHPMIGALKQFSIPDCQAIKPESKKVGTSAHYVFVKTRLKWKKNKLMSAYRGRSNWRGLGTGFVLNTEELASIWHFPATWIKAPPVKAVESKRGVPPVNLPLERPSYLKPITEVEKEKPAEEKMAEGPPTGLPIV